MNQTLSYLKKECAIYTVAWQLYSFQGLFGIEAIAKYLLLILIAYSLYKTFYVIGKYKFEPFMKGLTLFFLLLSIYGIYHLLLGPTRHISTVFGQGFTVPTFFYLKYIYCSIPVVYVYYYYAKRGVFSPKSITKYTLFFIITTIPAFFNHYSVMADSNGAYIDGLTNNVGYKFVPIMALAFITSKWRNIIVVVCYIFIVLSLKRGAILIGTISFIAFLSTNIKTSKGIKKFRTISFSVFIILIASFSIIHFFENSQGFQKRIEMTIEGNSSGRDVIAKCIIDAFKNQDDVLVILFGSGADATIDIAGNYAHNDWLELLINQGILGVTVFTLLYALWFKNYLRMRNKVPANISMAFAIVLIGSFGCSIFSMAYTAFSPPISIVIGYCLYMNSRHKELIKINAQYTLSH